MQTELINYQDNDTALEGYLAYDENWTSPRPVVLICHDWAGRSPWTCEKAEKMVELGYVGFAVDMYGKGVLGQTNEEKTALMSPLMENRPALLTRVTAAYDAVRHIPQVDSQQMVIMGYCFGGLCALDLARSGVALKGAVSFHGGLAAPTSMANEAISAKLLVLHGHDDPIVPPQQVADFQKEMTEADVDWQIHVYGNTLHSFTNPEANDLSLGLAYSEAADRRSWQAMKGFLEEVFV